MDRRFQAKHARYSNFCIIKITAAIPNKFCTVTSKWSSYIVQNCSPQIPDGGRVPCGRNDKLQYPRNPLTDFDDLDIIDHTTYIHARMCPMWVALMLHPSLGIKFPKNNFGHEWFFKPNTQNK